MKIGDVVTYRNYGELRHGKVVKELGKDQLHVFRKDGPMAGSTAWIHRESVVSVAKEQ